MSTPKEHREQVALCQWLDLHDITYCAVPNAAKRSYKLAAYLKAEGLKPGFPDLLVFDTPPKDPDARGVAVEMKRNDKAAKLTPMQKWWQGRLTDCGWIACEAYGAEDAIAMLMSLGYGVRA